MAPYVPLCVFVPPIKAARIIAREPARPAADRQSDHILTWFVPGANNDMILRRSKKREQSHMDYQKLHIAR
jgi:hypothetical protein